MTRYLINFKRQKQLVRLVQAASFCTEKKSKEFFVTTPIFYVNGKPHLGHLYTAVIADAAQRFQKLLYPNTKILFSTGTDEHGLKVEKAANSVKKLEIDFCSEVSSCFKSLFDASGIQYTNYIRTTDPQHKISVQHFLQVLYDNGFIYKDIYEGWYCVSDESFLTQLQVVQKKLPDGSTINVSGESGHPVEWNKEVNYIFRLSSFKDPLLEWLETNDIVVPDRFANELKLWISKGLHNLSISRPNTRVSWGIPLPWDSGHTVYVWVDALVNYLTVAGYPNLKVWPPNVQVIGKDILRFHGVYWPALLMAAGLKPLEKLHVHSHWIVDDQKMSKSLENILCPKELQEKYSVDGVRYLLLRNGTPHSDSSWNSEKAVFDINAELVNTLGNLLNRLRPLSLNPEQIFPAIEQNSMLESSETCKNLVSQMNSISEVVGEHFSSFNYYKGIEVIMDMLRTANGFIDEQKPWELKSNPDRTQLDFVIGVGFSAAKVAGIALQPIIPSISDKLLISLGISEEQRSWSQLDNPLSGQKRVNLGAKNILFERLKK